MGQTTILDFRKYLPIVLLILLEILTTKIYSQSSCPNSDFESGTLAGWRGQVGNCCPIFTSPSGIVSGRHTIMSGTATDPNTCNVVTVVAPGGLYSARVGNDQVGAQAETLAYSVVVTPSSSLFIYKYAVVLQDPGHNPTEQPRFQVRVLDSGGNLIDPTCGVYTVVAAPGLAGFQSCPNSNGDVVYRDWTTVGLDLSAYMGQTIVIEFETGDCSPGAHFGYAYVDAYCSPLQIGATFCSSSFAAELVAPIGFSSYLWSNGATTRSITVTSPAAGTNYSCTLTSVTGCTVVISTVLQLENPTADFTMTNTCFNNAVFQDTTVLSNPTLLDGYLWEFGDGTTSSDHNPTHSFPGTGTYTVKFTTFNAFGCTTTATKTITVYNPPTANIAYSYLQYCTSDTALETITLTGTDNYTGGTYSVDVPGLSFNPLNAEFTPSTSVPGPYIVTYTIPTSNGCTVPPVTTTVEVSLAPQATITYSAPSFCNLINFPQSVNLTGVGLFTGGVYTATPPGLSIDATTGAIRPNLSSGGNYTITYSVPQGAACISIDDTTTVTIVEAATASISYATPFCNSLTTPQIVTLTGTGIIGTGFYSSNPSGLQLNTATGEVVPSLSTPGNYTVDYTIPALGGCSSFTVTTNVSVTELPTAAISYAGPYCLSITTPEAVLLTGTAAYLGGIYSAPAGVTVNSTTGAITPSSSIAGTHEMQYAIPHTLGCTPQPVSTFVTLLPLPEPILSNLTVCEDPRGVVFRPAVLDTGLSDAQYSCQWFLNGTPVVPNVVTNQYTTTLAGNYSVLVTNLATGCISPAAVAIISTAVTVEDFMTYVTNTFVENNTLTILVSGGTGPYLFSVDDGPFQASNVFTELEPGIHSVSITDVNNCTDVTKPVMVLGYPSYFTPNGDGFNDFWNIYYFDTKPNAKISIFDRYGKMLKQLSPQSPGWDGTYNGKMMPSTDYWFLVEFKDFNEKGELVWQTFKAHFSMMR